MKAEAVSEPVKLVVNHDIYPDRVVTQRLDVTFRVVIWQNNRTSWRYFKTLQAAASWITDFPDATEVRITREEDMRTAA